MEESKIKALEQSLEEEIRKRVFVEKILEDKSRNVQSISRELKLANLKLQKLLHEKSSQLDGIFENINDAYVVIDFSGNFIKMNDVAEHLFGYDLEKEKLNIIDLLYYKHDKNIKDSFDALLKSESFSNYIVKIITKNKEVKWTQTNASLVYGNGKNRKPTAVQGIVRDITDVKKLEIQKANFLKKIKKSNIELEEYAHIVSHDLKSPLRSLNALLSWIKSDNIDKFDDNTKSNFRLAEETLTTMDTLISDLLDYSSAGLNDKKNIKVDLDELVFNLKKTLYIPKHISIHILKKLPVIIGSKIKLQQLFQNLISNAVKFIDKENGIIEIDFIEQDKHYQFYIQDNGIGIEKKYQKKIFKIFQVLNKDKNSTGVGLSIVKKIVNLYEGDIWLESTPKIGTKFIFTLKK